MPRVTLAKPLRDELPRDEFVKKTEGRGITLPPPPIPLRGGEGRGVLPQTGCVDVVGEIKNLANTLGPTERKRLLAELSLDAADADTADVRDLDLWATAVYWALVAANGGSAGAVPGPAIVKRALSAAGGWGYVRGFMADAKFDTLAVPERQAVYKMLADLVVTQAQGISRNSHAPLGPKLVANCSQNIAGLFDQNFPGYLRAGLALVVAKQLVRTAA